MTKILLDPTGERRSPHASASPDRHRSDGQVVGLLDIGKARGDVFLDQLEQRARRGRAKVRRFRSRRSPSPPRSTCATRSPRSARW